MCPRTPCVGWHAFKGTCRHTIMRHHHMWSVWEFVVVGAGWYRTLCRALTLHHGPTAGTCPSPVLSEEGFVQLLHIPWNCSASAVTRNPEFQSFASVHSLVEHIESRPVQQTVGSCKFLESTITPTSPPGLAGFC